jgi:biopolymer transport protein ExbB
MSAIATFLDAGGPLMWLILLDALVLYALLAERAWTLYGVGTRFHPEEIHALLGGHEHIRHLSQAIALGDEPELTRFFALIRGLIAVAPMLGLLGTVGGMIVTFDGILAGQRLAAAGLGIGEALLTTQFGLAVAVPAVLLEGLLRRRSKRLTSRYAQLAASTQASRER